MKSFKEFKEEKKLEESVVAILVTVAAALGIGIPLFFLILDDIRYGDTDESVIRRVFKKLRKVWWDIQMAPEWKQLMSNPEFRKVLKDNMKPNGAGFKRNGRFNVLVEIRKILPATSGHKLIHMLDSAHEEVKKEIEVEKSGGFLA